ncbi:MAG: Mur ligase family protein [Candidatus Eisenbacteria bacterium]
MTASPDRDREAIERLYGLERGNRGPFGLAGTRALLDDLGRPERAFASIHVAGTNGKGSTSAMIERLLREGGTRTGLFTSPHLVNYRERIRVDGRAVPPGTVSRLLDRVGRAPAATGRTFFEVTFALGALAFEEREVGVAVLETGLGGRLDSTNVAAPALTVLTPIGLDHVEWLGDTIEAIAGEKAGILKPGIPVVVAEQDRRALAVIERQARALGAPLVPVSEIVTRTIVHALDARGSDVAFEVRGVGEVRARLPLLGRHQVANAAVALAAARVHAPALSASALARGLAGVRWPGRFEAATAEPRLFWDGAHNQEGAATLRAAWRDALGDAPGALVLGLSEDKDPGAMLAALAGPWRRVFAVAADSPRARDAGDLARRVVSAWPGVPVIAAPSVADGVARAISSLEPGELALACGSLFVVGEAMAAVGGGDLECL